MPASSFLPLALGPFISGGMLLWGLVAAVPIVLHLLKRRRRQTVAWPAMQFLLDAVQRRSRNIQLWQWLLLLARVAAVLLIAAALANPILRQAAPAPSRPPQTHVLVIDTSYSMMAIGASGETRFQTAIDSAIEYCGSAAQGDRFVVVAMQAEPLAIVSRPSADVGAVQQEIRRMQASYMSASLPATLSLVERLTPSSAAPELHAVFFTDAQQRTWQSAVDGAGRDAWQSLRQRAVKLQIVDVTADDPTTAGNATLSGLEAPAADRLTVAARSDGAQQSGTQLNVFVDEQSVHSARLPFNEAGDAWTDIAVLAEDHESVVRAELQEDGLSVDNTRWLVRRPQSVLRVVCLGTPQTTRFLAAAMSAGGETVWNVQQSTVQQWSEQANAEVDLLMLCDLPRIDPSVADAVQRVRSSGGGVVWWLGPAAEPSGYAVDSVPFRLSDPVESDLYPLDPRGYQHPIAAPFAPYPQSGLLSTPIFRYWRLSPPERADSGEMALGLGVDSAPFVLTFERQMQRSVVVTSAPMVAQAGGADPPWNALVAWPSLVPLVQEIAAWATAPLQASRTITVGDTVSATALRRDQVPQQVVAPDEEVLKVHTRTLDSGIEWNAGLAMLPGIYTLTFADQSQRRWAVNVDPDEGELRPVDVNALQKLATDDDLAPQAVQQPAAQTVSPRDGYKWFRWLLAAAMGCLVAESLISRFALRWQA